MSAETNSPAIWILVVTGLFAIMEIGAAVALFFFPESMADQIDLNATGTKFLMYMWATRQFALGVIFAFAIYKRSGQMLTLSYIFFLVMFLGDGVVGIMLHDNSLLASAVLMCIVAAGILYKLFAPIRSPL